MATGNRKSIYWATATFLAVALAVIALQGCKREKPAAPESSTPPGGVKAVTASNKEPAKNPIETAADLFRGPKVSIQNIVKAANDRWTPVCPQWWDKPAPDFTLTDIEGQTHKLSDYKGKELIVAFWTTYAGPCRLEVSHFKELRNTFPSDKLAILAISSEPTAIIKAKAAELGINYTLLTNSGSLPTPFDQVKNIPTTFFVGADGKFKLAIEGMVPAADAKAIVQAQ
jgi:peroxiredoxin